MAQDLDSERALISSRSASEEIFFHVIMAAPDQEGHSTLTLALVMAPGQPDLREQEAKTMAITPMARKENVNFLTTLLLMFKQFILCEQKYSFSF